MLLERVGRARAEDDRRQSGAGVAFQLFEDRPAGLRAAEGQVEDHQGRSRIQDHLLGEHGLATGLDRVVEKPFERILHQGQDVLVVVEHDDQRTSDVRSFHLAYIHLAEMAVS
jgi:hypothetical protein